MANFLIARGTETSYNNLTQKSSDTIYITSVNGVYNNLYLGSDLITSKVKDATYVSGVFTITKNDGTTVQLDFSDIASASAVGAAIKDAIENVATTAKETYIQDVTYTHYASSDNQNPVAASIVTVNKDNDENITSLTVDLDVVIDPIKANLDSISASVSSLKTLIDSDDNVLDDTINRFDEVVAFLDGFDDSEASTLESAISGAIDDVVGASTDTWNDSTKTTIWAAKNYTDSAISTAITEAISWVELDS